MISSPCYLQKLDADTECRILGENDGSLARDNRVCILQNYSDLLASSSSANSLDESDELPNYSYYPYLDGLELSLTSLTRTETVLSEPESVWGCGGRLALSPNLSQ